MSKKSKAKEQQQVDNFEHNAKMLQAAMVEAGLTSQNIAAKILKNELVGVDVMARSDDDTYKDLTDHVIKTMAVAEGMILHFKSLGVKQPNKKLRKQMRKVCSAGKALVITSLLCKDGSPRKIKRIGKCKLDLSQYENQSTGA